MTLPDSLREALGQVIANERREWRREREVIEAQGAQVIAELRAEIATLRADRLAVLSSIDQAVAERLAALQDGAPGQSVTIEDVAPLIADQVGRAVAALPVPVLPDIAAIARAEVVTAVSTWPEPVGLDEVRAIVAAEVGKLPAPRDGLDADPAEIEALVRAEVGAAVAALPPPKDGENGTSVTPADVEPLVREAVQAAVAALPAPKDGEDGTCVEPEAVRAIVEEIVAALPPPARGEPGPPGKLPVVRAWSDRVHYEADVVTHEGAVYQAQRDTGRAPPHDDWSCIAKAGRDGEDGRSFTIRDTWAAAIAYRQLDVVILNGASFVARRDDPGPCPGEGWQMIARQGKAGPPPEPSAVREAVKAAVAALPPPKKGDPGPPVVALDVDPQGLLTLTNADGSVVTCDLYPVLSKAAR